MNAVIEVIEPVIHESVPEFREAVLEMARAMHRESPVYRRMPFESDVILSWLDAYDRGAVKGAYLVATMDGVAVGFMAILSERALFSHDRIVSDLALYVVPEYRHGPVGGALVDAAEAWAINNGVTRITVGVTAGIDKNHAISFYEARDYSLVGAVLAKELV